MVFDMTGIGFDEGSFDVQHSADYGPAYLVLSNMPTRLRMPSLIYANGLSLITIKVYN